MAVRSSRAATAISRRRAIRSAASPAEPAASAQRPIARRRSYSICQSRSWAAAKPCPNHASISFPAAMCATPQRSRRIVTSPISPAQVSSVRSTVTIGHPLPLAMRRKPTTRAGFHQSCLVGFRHPLEVPRMPANPPLNWDLLFDEAVDILCRYIRIDTSNPPGNEIAACEFLGEILTGEGIPFETFDAGGGRVSLRAVLRGDGSERPFMLLNHTDVVPVQREYWSEEPFSGLIKDGHIWGRGALDMKGLGVAQLITFLTVKRLGIPLKRDLVFYA